MKKILKFLGVGIITISLFMIFISVGNYRNSYQSKNEYHIEYKIEGQPTYKIEEQNRKSIFYEVEEETNNKHLSTIEVLVIILIGIIVSAGVVFLIYVFVFSKKGDKKTVR